MFFLNNMRNLPAPCTQCSALLCPADGPPPYSQAAAFKHTCPLPCACVCVQLPIGLSTFASTTPSQVHTRTRTLLARMMICG